MEQNNNQSLLRRFPTILQANLSLVISLVLTVILSSVLSFFILASKSTQMGFTVNMVMVILTQFICILPPVLIIMRRSRVDFTATVRLKKKLNFVQLFIMLFIAAGCIMFANGLNSIFILGLQGVGYTPSSTLDSVPDTVPRVIFMAAIYGILPALFEELFFRGLIMRSYERYSPAVAVIASAVLFGIMHGNIEQLLFAMIGGAIFAVVVLITDSLWASILIHFANNVFAVIDTYITMQSPAENQTVMQYFIRMSLLSLVGAALLAVGIFVLYKYTRHLNLKKTGRPLPEELEKGFSYRLIPPMPINSSPAGKHPFLAYLPLIIFVVNGVFSILVALLLSFVDLSALIQRLNELTPYLILPR